MIDSIITMVLDASASMRPVKAATIEGFNAFLDEQRKLRDGCWLNLIQFGTSVVPVWERKDLHKADSLSEGNYPEMGATALLDAIGDAIKTTERQTMMADAEMAQVFVVIQTDGVENASRQYSRDGIRTLVQHKIRVEGWQFIFLGANQCAEEVARDLGINAQQALTYSHKKGTKQAFIDVAQSVREARENDEPAKITDEAKKAQRLLLECKD